jgi:hypothetical protein
MGSGGGRRSHFFPRSDGSRIAKSAAVVYLEHCLTEAGVPTPSTVVIMTMTDAAWALRDLADEIHEVAPAASIEMVAAGDTVPACDLAVVPLAEPCCFPLEDVSYRRLPELRRILPSCRRARDVLLYRLDWREGEVVPRQGIRRWLWRRRAEALGISLLHRLRSLRRAAATLRG